MTGLKRRLLGTGAAFAATGMLASGFVGAASAAPVPSASTPYGGFISAATATPLRLELYEPAIPLPASPQGELNFSYTTVTGASGPASTAKASALWPGPTVGDGLPVILATMGLPAALAANNYPFVTAAQYPGTPNSASQEYFPGMVGQVSGSSTQAVSRAGYSTSGQVAGDPSSGGAGTALSQLQSGSLSGLTGLLGGSTSTSGTGSTNPLGLLSAVVNVGGMSASSVTDYGDKSTIDAIATSQVGEVDLLGGIVKLSGVTVSATSASSLSGGKSTPSITYGGMTINGTPFNITANGIQAASSTTTIPGMPSDPNQALASLGISIDLPKPTTTTTGTQATTAASGPVITIDTQPIISKLQLNQLPLASVINQFPDSAGQLKSTLLGILQAHPKIVVMLGNVSSSANTIALLNLGLGSSTPPTGDAGAASTTGGSGAVTTATPPPAAVPPVASTTVPVKKTSAAPGLPPLGSVPAMLALAGLLLAAGAAWMFRTMALGALGAAGTCIHGLTRGLPDLRKA